MVLSTPFLTQLDSRAAIKGSRDPLGVQMIWTRLGRHVVANRSSATRRSTDCGGRSHRVEVREADDSLELRAVVARAAAVRDVADLPLRIWRHNRASQLVSFRVDRQGRVCASGWVPKHGLTTEEFLFVLHRVAAESGRLEFILTGKDEQ